MRYQIDEGWAQMRSLLEQYLEGLITFSELVTWLARCEGLREIRAADFELRKHRPDLFTE
jgi:hypothetical protein